MDQSGFSRIPEIVVSGSSELQVCQYADLRVAPHGVASLEERLEDFSKRYGGAKDPRSESVHRASQELEQKIFAEVTIKPDDITDTAISPLIEELWEYPVP